MIKIPGLFPAIPVAICLWCTILLAAEGQAQSPVPAPHQLSPFGIGGDHHTGQDLTTWIPQMASLGLKMMRTAANPEQMSYLDAHQMEYGGLLLGVPPGDTLDAPGSLPVKDLAAWSAHVTKRVQEAKGRIRYWEVWNEPPNFIGKGQTPADYAQIVISAYDAIKAVDPQALVGLTAKSVHINYLEQVIQAGAKDHFDYISLHPYEALGVAVDGRGAEAVFMSIAPKVRKMLAAQNPSKVNVPIFFTELGCDTRQGLEHQAYSLLKAYTMSIAQGIACIEWFEGIDGDSGPMGLMDAKGVPRPAYTALAQMIKYLGQYPSYVGWLLLNERDYAFVFQGAAGPVLLTWAPGGSTDHLQFTQPVNSINPLTGAMVTGDSLELTNAPVLITNVPPALLTQAAASQGKPFPWGGDFTDAKSVSITMGSQDQEKGLHTARGAALAEDIVAYGGNARSGGVPGGNVFLVDPNFLSYTATPIEISIVVRRNANNDNAGFALKYESSHGEKSLGWFTVPDNKEWHTIKWKITDAQFVGMYGFNFALDSDGNQYNKYLIQSITVTKL